MLNVGALLDLYIDCEASEMAEYDGWGEHDNHRVNVFGDVRQGHTVTVKIISFEGGSYFAEAPRHKVKSESDIDEDDNDDSDGDIGRNKPC